MLTKREFIDQLRDALGHLYNPEHLRQNPLATIFGVAKRFDTASALQRILIEAINSLEPPPDEPHHSPAWQIYEPLYYRYVEQLSSEQVADQMAIGERHLRRKQRLAVEALADVLWQQYNLKDVIVDGDDDDPLLDQEETTSSIVDEELAWLKDTSTSSSAVLHQSLEAVQALAQKLADHHRVRLDIALDGSYPQLAVDPVALRQMILNLLQVAVPRASGGGVHVSAKLLRWEVAVRIWCPEYPSGSKPILNDESDNLNMTQSLADLSGCKLTLAVDARSFDATLTIPALDQLPVLVIDDNQDALQMFSRYATGTRFHLITSSDPEQAVTLAETLHPRVIVMDVMMPRVDGWELLQRLRQNPATADIPLIVCTILAQKELALLLGANDFLRKPVTRQAFLEALNRCVA